MPQYDLFRTRVDIYKLIRQLKLKVMFGAMEQPVSSEKNFKPPSSFVLTVFDLFMQVFENLVLLDVQKLECNKSYRQYNLSESEHAALRDLVSDDSIIFKEADKGGAVVVMNKVDCVNANFLMNNITADSILS